MTSRQYKHQQDRIQQGWSKVHVMLDPETTKDLANLCEAQGMSITEMISAAIRALYQADMGEP